MVIVDRKTLVIGKHNQEDLTYDEVHKRYTPLVNSIAVKYYQIPWDDAQQIAYIGLWRAYEKYDIQKNGKVAFGHYASIVITSQFRAYLRDKNRLKRTIFDEVHLDDCIPGTEMTFGETLHTEDTIVENIERKEAIESVTKAMKSLNPKLRKVIHMYYTQGLTQKEIAKIIGTCRCSVSKMCTKATKQVKQTMKWNKWRG